MIWIREWSPQGVVLHVRFDRLFFTLDATSTQLPTLLLTIRHPTNMKRLSVSQLDHSSKHQDGKHKIGQDFTNWWAISSWLLHFFRCKHYVPHSSDNTSMAFLPQSRGT